MPCLPTFWCAKCNSWSSHYDKIHDERIQWQNMKDAQIAKQVEQRKQNQQNQYGPPQQQDRQYGRNDNNKRSNTAYGRDGYQDKRSQNDRRRSSSRDRYNSTHTNTKHNTKIISRRSNSPRQRNRTTQNTPRKQRKHHIGHRQCNIRTRLPHLTNQPTIIT
jgi:hypothetical protein